MVPGPCHSDTQAQPPWEEHLPGASRRKVPEREEQRGTTVDHTRKKLETERFLADSVSQTILLRAGSRAS